MKKNAVRIGIMVAVVVIAYFVNVEVQTHLGKKALKATGLEALALDEALARAGEQGKPVLADLSAIWCPSCRKLDKNVLGDAAVRQKIHSDYIFARIEYESEAGAAFKKRYGVSGFPTLLILDENGEKIRQLSLTFEPDAFLEQL